MPDASRGAHAAAPCAARSPDQSGARQTLWPPRRCDARASAPPVLAADPGPCVRIPAAVLSSLPPCCSFRLVGGVVEPDALLPLPERVQLTPAVSGAADDVLTAPDGLRA